MNAPRPSWRGVVGIVMTVAAVAVITFGLLSVLGVTFGGAGSADVGDGSQLGGLFAVAERDHVAICVQTAGVDSGIQPVATLAVGAALSQLEQRPEWALSGLGVAPTEVQGGCPTEPALHTVGVPPGGRETLFEVTGGIVKHASYYLVHVYVVPQEEIDRYGRTYRWAIEEKLRHGPHTLVGVTQGVYISPGELDDTAFLIRLLEVAMAVK